MDKNKNRLKDRPKSNAELRKMKPKDNSDLGMINGNKLGQNDSKTQTSTEDKI